MTVNTFQVSLMSHSCVSNLEVVNPPSRSISFRVKRPVRTISLSLVSCFFTSWSTKSTAKPSQSNILKTKWPGVSVFKKKCLWNFSQKSHQVLLWIGIHLVQQPSLVDRKSESATLLVLEKRWKCNCAYPQKVKVHEQIVQGSCHLHVFLPLCTWRGKERQSLHFTWHFIFYLSISACCLTSTLAVLILFLVYWDIEPRSMWITAPRSIPALRSQLERSWLGATQMFSNRRQPLWANISIPGCSNAPVPGEKRCQ